MEKILQYTLRLIKNSQIFYHLPKTKNKGSNIMLQQIAINYSRIQNILKEDPYNKLFLDSFNIKTTYFYKDILKNDKLIAWIILINLHQSYGIQVPIQEMKNLYKTWIYGKDNS